MTNAEHPPFHGSEIEETETRQWSDEQIRRGRIARVAGWVAASVLAGSLLGFIPHSSADEEQRLTEIENSQPIADQELRLAEDIERGHRLLLTPECNQVLPEYVERAFDKSQEDDDSIDWRWQIDAASLELDTLEVCPSPSLTYLVDVYRDRQAIAEATQKIESLEDDKLEAHADLEDAKKLYHTDSLFYLTTLEAAMGLLVGTHAANSCERRFAGN